MPRRVSSAVPGVADLAVGVACGEQAAQFGVACFADAFVAGGEQFAGPVQRVVFVASVSECLVLDSAADFV